MHRDGERRGMTRRALLRRWLALGVGASTVGLLVDACSTTRPPANSVLPQRITPIASQPGLIIQPGTPTASPGAGTPAATP
ncbi:MAG TPA: hypothetical protein VFI42_15760 [Thermomicrobiaceae bacterium]|nr:hypothetical protein [Thermomicrobiaceae bacterium]